MTELSPSAAALVRACRSAIQPSMAEQDRVAAALRVRLGSAALPIEAGSASSAVSRLGWAKVSAVGAAIGLASGVALFVLREPTSPKPTPATRPFIVAHTETPSPSDAAPPKAEPEALTGAAVEPVASTVPRPPADRLRQEVAIMSRATSDLHAGHPASALQAVAEHQRKFPNGVLAEERRAARVQALCALGRRGEAAADLDRLLRLAPRSPTTLRAAQLCGVSVSGRSR